MEVGTKVYEGYVGVSADNWWINEGTVSGLVVDGKPLVRHAEMLIEMGDRWRLTRVEAKADVVTQLLRRIGKLQATVDELKDDMLHEVLTKEAAA
jgi:hypothetical protein